MLESDVGVTWPLLISRVVITTLSPLAIASTGSVRASQR